MPNRQVLNFLRGTRYEKNPKGLEDGDRVSLCIALEDGDRVSLCIADEKIGNALRRKAILEW
jgi:hypothetical protein